MWNKGSEKVHCDCTLLEGPAIVFEDQWEVVVEVDKKAEVLVGGCGVVEFD